MIIRLTQRLMISRAVLFMSFG
jgi:hypothetical protein